MQRLLKCVALLALWMAFAATAATEQYTLYLDTDGVTTEQCAAGSLSGADAKIDISVDNSTNAITAVTLSICNNTSFTPPSTLELSDWSLSIGTGIDDSDVIYGRIPLAQLGNPTTINILASSSVDGNSDTAGSEWLGISLDTSSGSDSDGATDDGTDETSDDGSTRSVPALGTVALGTLLFLFLIVSIITYRRRFGHYHWLFIVVCLPLVTSLAWALTWTTVITDAQETGSSGDIRQVKLANDSAYLYVQLIAHIGADSNQAPTDIALSNTTVAENSDGAVIGMLSTTDADSDDTHTYSVSDSRFEVSGNQLKLKAGQALDYETETSVALTITTTDSGGLTFSKAFTITVTDDTSDNSVENQAPTDITLSNTTVAENDDGAVIGTLSTTDANSDDTHTYSVSDSRFEVFGNQLKLKAGQALDYETETSVALTITTTDSGGLTFSKAFTITVTDDTSDNSVENQAPTDITLSSTTVAENNDGAVIGTLSTTDADSDDTHTYSVSDSRFEVSGNQLKLKAGQALDYETETSVALTVTTTDSGGLTFSKAFTIVVMDDSSDNNTDNVIITRLNDTGITACGTANSTSNSTYCSTAVANASDSQVPLGQDGHYGTGKDGSKGMVFEKVSGYEDKCVQDMQTGLMWEVKQYSGLHSRSNSYTWYSTTNNGGYAGTQNGGSCSDSDCDTSAFVDAVNAVGWCGYNDWRLPTLEELHSIVDYSRYDPAIDTTYFPQTKNGFYWSSTPLAYFNSSSARGIYFGYGLDYSSFEGKDDNNYVRLVRNGQ